MWRREHACPGDNVDSVAAARMHYFVNNFHFVRHKRPLSSIGVRQAQQECGTSRKCL